MRFNSGSAGVNVGAIPQRLPHRILVSATEVRELMSSARILILSIGTFENTATDAISPRRSNRHVGDNAVVAAQVWIAGTRPRSIRPSCSSDAHFDGTSKRTSNSCLMRGGRKPAASYSDRNRTQSKRCHAVMVLSIGVKPAAAMFRRTSSTGVRRFPSDSSSTGETRSSSLAPNVSATCASLGPYVRQSTWIVGTRWQCESRQRHRPHVVVTGGRDRD